jgi:hypothetical protein
MPYLTTKMIGRLEKDYRPVLDAFEKNYRQMWPVRSKPRHAPTGFVPRFGATRAQRQCPGHLRHAGQMSCSTPATKSQAYSGSRDRRRGSRRSRCRLSLGRWTVPYQFMRGVP